MNKSYLTFKLPLLALDMGLKRIGVAVSDRRGLSCSGIACLYRQDSGWMKQMQRHIDEYACTGIVLGLPKNMDGTEGVQAKDCRQVGVEIEAFSALPVYFHDERLSSWAARQRLHGMGLNEKKTRARLDQTAAAIILEDFLSVYLKAKAELT